MRRGSLLDAINLRLFFAQCTVLSYQNKSFRKSPNFVRKLTEKLQKKPKYFKSCKIPAENPKKALDKAKMLNPILSYFWQIIQCE